MLIGIGHNMQVGKDTAAQALCRDAGYRRIAFADKLKDLAIVADPLITTATRTLNVGIGHGKLKHAVQGLGWEQAKAVYPEVRLFLQQLGLGARQVFGEDFWITQALAGVGPDERVVVSDVRFINEAENIKEAGGYLIKIMRPGFNGDGHVSERELASWDGWDFTIENSGSLDDLERAVVKHVRGVIQ
jgi:hypothetical protein